MAASVHSPRGVSRRDELLSRIGRDELRRRVLALSNSERRALAYSWDFFARPAQQEPTIPYQVWLILGGRGFGKTLTGAQYVRSMVESGRARSVALIAPTAADIRDTMVEGISGIIEAFPPSKRPEYIPSKRRIKFKNGAIATTYTGEEPEQLRGPNHDLAWIDEAAACRYIDEIWLWLIPSLRAGPDPKVIVTTTPKPVKILYDLCASGSTVLTTGSTYDNAHNLPATMLRFVEETYGSTELGDQELGGRLLGNAPGAMFRQAWINTHRVSRAPELTSIAVAIDPSSSTSREACEVGLVVVGRDAGGFAYILEDASGIMTPAAWIARAAELRRKWKARAIVYESNYGKGFIEDLFKLICRDEARWLHPVHADVGKAARATPVVALVEKGRVRFVGTHLALETQLTTWIPGSRKSPDRLDALVHAVTYLVLGSPAHTYNAITLT